VGLLYNASMMGVGGMGFGIVIRMLPFRRKKLDVPDTRSWSRLRDRTGGSGWIKAALRIEGKHPTLVRHGDALPIRLVHTLRSAATGAAREGATMLAHVRREDDGRWVCDRLMEIPSTTQKVGGFAVKWALGLGAMGIAAMGWWIFVGAPLLFQLVGPSGVLVP